MSLVSLIKGTRGDSGFGYASTAEEVTRGLDLRKKVVAITGVNSGLGAETARVLSMRGAHIIGLARSQEKAQAKCDELGDATAVSCELSDLRSVQSAAETIRTSCAPIDVLICNAGIMALPDLEQVEGYEKQFFTNHVGHFLLIRDLLDHLRETARVIILSSSGHRLAMRGLELDNLSGDESYSPWRAYGRSKLANALCALALAKRFEGTKRTANAVHPGMIHTNLERHLNSVLRKVYAATDKLYAKSVGQGAATICYVATSPQIEGTSGRYFADCNLEKPSRKARDHELANELWRVSDAIVESVLAS